MFNIDTGTAVTLVSENSPVRHQLKAHIAGRPMVMCQTAYQEFVNIYSNLAGPLEKARATRLIAKLSIVPDTPSLRAQGLKPSRKVGIADIIVFGTGDALGYETITADAKFVRGATAQV